jgi:hypothetical protein
MKKLTSAKEFWVELDQLNSRIENTLHSLVLNCKEIQFPSQYQFQLELNDCYDIAGLKVVDEVFTHIVLNKADAYGETSYDIMSTRFTQKDRLRALEVAEVVLMETSVDKFYNEAKARYGDTLRKLAD